MKKVCCMDCGKPYNEFPLDMSLPDEQWRMIHPSGGGVLCANCIVERASKLPHTIAIRAVIDFGKTDWQKLHIDFLRVQEGKIK